MLCRNVFDKHNAGAAMYCTLNNLCVRVEANKRPTSSMKRNRHANTLMNEVLGLNYVIFFKGKIPQIV